MVVKLDWYGVMILIRIVIMYLILNLEIILFLSNYKVMILDDRIENELY